MVRLLEAIVLHLDLYKVEVNFSGNDASRARVSTHNYVNTMYFCTKILYIRNKLFVKRMYILENPMDLKFL